MLLQSLPLVFVLAGLALYTVLAGADFGAGFWQLFAGPGAPAERIVHLDTAGLPPEAFAPPAPATGDWFVVLADRAGAKLASGDPDGVGGQDRPRLPISGCARRPLSCHNPRGLSPIGWVRRRTRS